MKNALFWQILGLIVIVAVSVALTYWIYTATMASNLPDWVKYIILH